MNNKEYYLFLEKTFKEYPEEKEKMAKEMEKRKNTIRLAVEYDFFMSRQSVIEIKRFYGEIGVFVLMEIMVEKNIPIPQEVLNLFYENKRDKEISRPLFIFYSIMFCLMIAGGVSTITELIMKLIYILQK